MALDLETTYSPRINAADSDYPFGSIKNATTPLTGTPLDEDWANDIFGFLQKLLNDASITPSGVPDTVNDSDYFDGLNAAIDARTGLELGVKTVFYQASAPTGWTQVTTHNDKALRVVSGSGGGSGGSLALSSSTTGNHTLLEGEMPQHNHTESYYQTSGGSFSLGSGPDNPSASKNTGSTGGDGDHNHPLALAYIDVIVCSKD